MIDLGSEVRQLLWRSGWTSRQGPSLVPAPVGYTRRRRSPAKWSPDLIAVTYTPLVGNSILVATSVPDRDPILDRLYWMSGVARAMGGSGLLAVPAASIGDRTLARELGLTILDREDLVALVGRPNDHEARPEIRPASVQRYRELVASATDKIRGLERYRTDGYWQFPRSRALTWLPSYLETAPPGLLRASNASHVALVLDLAWLFLLSVLTAADDAAQTSASAITPALRRFIAGSDLDLRDRERAEEIIRRVISHAGASEIRAATLQTMPRYFGDIEDLVHRIIRRRRAAGGALRVLEYVGIEIVAGGDPPSKIALAVADPIEIKIASDAIRLLVGAGGASQDFVDVFDDLTSQPHTAAPPSTTINLEQLALLKDKDE